METSKVETIAIEYNEYNEPVKVLRVKTLNKDLSTSLKEKAIENQKKIEKKKLDYQVSKDLEQQNEKTKIDVLKIMLSYSQFTNLVEKGLAETTEEFEQMYQNFLLTGSAFNEELCPIVFATIYGRVK